MQIVELGDYSMVVMKDSNDPYWYSVGRIYRSAQRENYDIKVVGGRASYQSSPNSADAIYTAGKLILFFKDKVSNKFKVHDKVELIFVHKN